MDMSRYLFREVLNEDDADGIIELVRSTGYHSDNLPRNNPSLIKTNVRTSRKDFALAHPKGNKRPLFMFVLVDTDTDEVVGTSLIKSMPYCLAYDFYFDRNMGEYVGELALKSKECVWQLGGLLLSKKVRGMGLAKLLSYGRLAYLATINLWPRMLMTGFFKDSFWEYITKAIGIPGDSDSAVHWHNFKTLSTLMRLLPARIFMKDAGIVFGSSGEPRVDISIHSEAELARKLLVHMWFRPLDEIEADGTVWYGSEGSTVRDRFTSHEIFPDRIQLDVCKASCHTDIGVAVLPSHDFRAQYISVAKTADGSVCVSKEDFSCGKPKRLFIF